MKMKNILIAGSLLFSVMVFSQKEELKSLKKIYGKDEIKGNDLAEYKALVNKVETLAVDEGDKVYAAFYKAMVPVLEANAIDGKTMTPQQMQMAYAKLVSPKSISDLATGLNATLEYEKKSGKKIYTDDINETITSFKPQLIDFGIALGKMNKNKEASDVFYSIYTLDKKDADLLFYAASYAVNANDYDNALRYYEELKRLNYSGESTIYHALNNSTKQEENFGNNKQLRDLAISSRTHSKPRDEKTPSQRGEIAKNIALILVNQGKKEEAKQAYKDARRENPNDDSLLLGEANLYLTLNDFETYGKLVNEALAKDPNNPELLFNLGAVSANAKNLEAAEGYYKKAIEIDPKYFNAYLNLAELKMRGDQKYVEEINKLGTSDKELKRYEVLKAERNKNFMAILPYLEKAVELKPENEEAKRALISLYNALEMTDKAKALKATLPK